MSDDSARTLRGTVYCLLIVVGLGSVMGRILALDAVDRTAVQDYLVKKRLNELKLVLQKQGIAGRELEQALEAEKARLPAALAMRRPFLSANDRSRWCAVRALVEPEMRVDGAPYAIDKVIQQPGWDTIDMVKHGGHLYSSKPPLMSTLMAGPYWLIYRLTGRTLAAHPFEIGRFMILSINVLSLLVFFLALAGLIERLGTSDWGRMFAMAAAVFGTFLSTFAITINNHLPAAACAAVLLCAAVRIWWDDQSRWPLLALAGLCGALMVSDELPALSLLAVISLALLWKAPWPTLLAYLPAAALVTVAFFGTNWIAHHSLKPPYLHRDEGDNWYDYSYQRNGQTVQSYWTNRQGIDVGEPSPPRYALHVLVGHHGIFSLTPMWLLSVAGLLAWLWRGPDRRLRGLALGIGAVSVACVGFYLARPLVDRNYGGNASGFRWVFWLAPLWLVAMLPALDWMARRRWARGVALALLLVSVLSASYPLWNPWSPPWLMDFMVYLGLRP